MSKPPARATPTGKLKLFERQKLSKPQLLSLWLASFFCAVLCVLLLGSAPAPMTLGSGVLAMSAAILAAVRHAHTERTLRNLQLVDPQSRAASPTYFEEMCKEAQSSGEPFGLLVIDLTLLDEAAFALLSTEQERRLTRIAGHAIAVTRGTDLVGRLPGTRLAVLLAGATTQDQWTPVIRRLEKRIGSDPALSTSGIRQRITFGAAALNATEPLANTLYRAKQAQ